VRQAGDEPREDPVTEDAHAALSGLPQLDLLLRRDDVADLVGRHGRRVVADALRATLDDVRAEVRAGAEVPTDDVLAQRATRALERRARQRLTRVVNASGVVLHTNLGRAPLSKAAREALADAAGYTTLEIDLKTGRRGSRTAALGGLVAEACGTPDATVVNNGAAAMVLVLAALAAGRRVVVSRGELVEIGGSYRLPDIMAVSGSRLTEVGTTNRTRRSDYATAIDDETALLLKVHRSNFAMSGFTAEVAIGDLVELGRERGVPVVHDLGSGLLRETDDEPLRGEPSVETSVRAGADLVVFSGDKLLGGPQAGIIAGDVALVRACTGHPLARALRIDKLRRAALEATLEAHLRADPPVELPTIAMLLIDDDALETRARRIAESVGDPAQVARTTSVVGGGSRPDTRMPSWAVALPHPDPDALASALRDGAVPVIGRVEAGRVLLDVRTVAPSQDDELVALTRAALGA
jgi:L-seryl-tRNA(Ser) seleniumtransferase